MTAVREVIDLVLLLALIVLLGRLVLDWIQVFARDWRPKGPVLVVAEGVYTVTDPPIKAIRRVIPPLRLGGMSIDLAFMVLLLAIYILRAIV